MADVETILIQTSELITEGLLKTLSNTIFDPVSSVSSYDKVQVSSVCHDGDLLFIIGGENQSKTLQAVRHLVEHNEPAYIVILSKYDDPSSVLSALEAGARGYLRETITSEALLKALELVLLGETVVPFQFIQELCIHRAAKLTLVNDHPSTVSTSSVKSLTPQQTAVLRCITQGMPDKLIARRLQISDTTVKVHVKAILREIGVQNRTQAAVWAVVHYSELQASKHDFEELESLED